MVTEISLDIGYQQEARATGNDMCSLSGPWMSASLSGRRVSTGLKDRRQKPHAHISTMAALSPKIMESDN